MTKLLTLFPSCLLLLTAFKSRRWARGRTYAQREHPHRMHTTRCPTSEGGYPISEMNGIARSALVVLRTGLAIENRLAFQ